VKTEALVRLDPEQTGLRIVEALAGGLTKAAAIYRQYVEDGGDPMALRRHVPLSGELWRTLDDVAAGRIDVRVCCLPGRVAGAVRALPAQTQTTIIDKGVEVLADDGSGIRVPVQELTPDQTAQVFGPDGVRNVAQQAAWQRIKNATPSNPPMRPHVSFEVKRGKLLVYEPVELSAADLRRLLSEMA
jgi:hypothetical protein